MAHHHRAIRYSASTKHDSSITEKLLTRLTPAVEVHQPHLLWSVYSAGRHDNFFTDQTRVSNYVRGFQAFNHSLRLWSRCFYVGNYIVLSSNSPSLLSAAAPLLKRLLRSLSWQVICGSYEVLQYQQRQQTTLRDCNCDTAQLGITYQSAAATVLVFHQP